MSREERQSGEEGPRLTHVSEAGEVHMVDVAGKAVTARHAWATGTVRCQPGTVRAIRDQTTKKGDVLATIRLAGIQGAKRTAELVPLAHPIPIHSVTVDVTLEEDAIEISARVGTAERTGIEMEALTAVSCAALTAIDMIKGIDRFAYIENVRLEEKAGGRSGTWRRRRAEETA